MATWKIQITVRQIGKNEELIIAEIKEDHTVKIKVPEGYTASVSKYD